MPISYNKDTDYKSLMDAAIAAGDYKSAARFEQQRNAKIAGEGMTQYQPTHDLGSPYEAEFFTNEELGTAYHARQADQVSGNWTGSHGYSEGRRYNYGYSGGDDGSQYIPIQQPQRQQAEFSYQSAPAYVNQYQGLIDQLKTRIMEQDPFRYNAESDPLYQQYRDSYTRGGERAMRDTVGQLSARTGGMASSYAQSAAQQTYEGYMSALAGKIPQLQQLAYEMYQDEGEKQRLNLQMISALEREDYGKYQDLLSQYNTDRSFQYNQFRDQIADERYKDQTAYDRGTYTERTAYDRGVYADERDYDRKLQRAKLLAESGDFSGYRALGYSDEEVGRLRTAFLLRHPELAGMAWYGY